jgi:hypothetical protein
MLRRVALVIRFLQEPHDITSQQTPFFIVTAVKTSNLTSLKVFSQSKKPEFHISKPKIIRKWRNSDTYMNTWAHFILLLVLSELDRLCGLVVRVPGY